MMQIRESNEGYYIYFYKAIFKVDKKFLAKPGYYIGELRGSLICFGFVEM